MTNARSQRINAHTNAKTSTDLICANVPMTGFWLRINILVFHRICVPTTMVDVQMSVKLLTKMLYARALMVLNWVLMVKHAGRKIFVVSVMGDANTSATLN